MLTELWEVLGMEGVVGTTAESREADELLFHLVAGDVVELSQDVVVAAAECVIVIGLPAAAAVAHRGFLLLVAVSAVHRAETIGRNRLRAAALAGVGRRTTADRLL